MKVVLEKKAAKYLVRLNESAVIREKLHTYVYCLLSIRFLGGFSPTLTVDLIIAIYAGTFCLTLK